MNKRILISGGSRGIGAATVKYFAEHGDKVAFIYRSADEKAREIAEYTNAFPIKADVSDSQSAISAFTKAIEYLGGIDVLVNCARQFVVVLAWRDFHFSPTFRMRNGDACLTRTSPLHSHFRARRQRQ